jgi:hypothetical protein
MSKDFVQTANDVVTGVGLEGTHGARDRHGSD